ncbi:MAG: cation transporter [Planctomycetaceae bacterium]|nr:cation transporter [Planctomycetaceae bacterium]
MTSRAPAIGGGDRSIAFTGMMAWQLRDKRWSTAAIDREVIMPSVVFYRVLCVVAMVASGFAFELAGCADRGNGDASAAAKGAGSDAGSPVPREFAIEGMTCQGCADTITSALRDLPGVKSAKVSLADKRAIVLADASTVPSEKILAAIAGAGYKGRGASAAQAVSAVTEPSGKQPILVSITRGKNDLHAVSMAIGLAQSAIKDGRSATVFLSVEAPIFASKNLGEDVKFADFPPVKKMLADFIAAGGRVLVCGHCAHIDKLEPNDMIDGAKQVAHGELFTALTPGTVVFSY